MNLPQLTAEASLYQPRTQYRINARTSLFGSSGRGTITTAQGDTGAGDTSITVPGEVIYVHGTPPTGPTLTIPSDTGSGTKPGAPGGGSGGGKNKGNGRDGGNYNPTEGGQCCGNDDGPLQKGTYMFTDFADGNDWGCCTGSGSLCVSCDTQKNGNSISSTSCKDSWCVNVS